MQKIKLYLPVVLIAILQFIITVCFGFDKFFFDYSKINTNCLFFMRILYFIFLVSGWGFLFFVTRKVKSGDALFKRGLKIFLVYFSIVFLLLILTWPGLWSWDDLNTLTRAIFCNFHPWQHILTSIEYITFAQVLPFVGGIILIRNLIISMLVAFCVVQLETTFNLYLKNKFFDYVLKLAPFLLLPVLRYQLSGYRMGFYVYLEAALFVLLICAIQNKKAIGGGIQVLLILLTILVSTWRSESFLYLPLVCALFYFLNYFGSFKKRLAAIFAILIGFCSINCAQEYFAKKATGNNYKVVATIRQAVVLYRKAKGNQKNISQINKIDKVLNSNIIDEHPDDNGERMYWKYGLIRKATTDEDFKEYLSALVKLFFKYPGVIIKERTDLFVSSTGIYGKVNYPGIEHMLNILEKDKQLNKYIPFMEKWGKKCELNKVISKKIKKETIIVLCLWRNNFLYSIFWNSIAPITALIASCAYLIYKKKWAVAAIFLTVFIKLLLVIITAPIDWLMYYLSFYQIGYVIIFYTLVGLLRVKESGLCKN